MTSELSRRGLFRAFRPDAEQHDTQPAVAAQMVARISEACVEPRGVMCRRCGDECDTRAITFRPLGGGKARAALDQDICTGCGACLGTCPVAAISLIPAERVALIAGLVELGNGA